MRFLSERYFRVICKDCGGSLSHAIGDHLCFAGTNVSPIPDALNPKIYSKNEENLVESEEDYRESYGFQYGTEGRSVVANRVQRGD